ncbi:hypothetical protein ACMFMF_003622 [Clarireedia jacksonii]
MEFCIFLRQDSPSIRSNQFYAITHALSSSLCQEKEEEIMLWKVYASKELGGGANRKASMKEDLQPRLLRRIASNRIYDQAPDQQRPDQQRSDRT